MRLGQVQITTVDLGDILGFCTACRTEVIRWADAVTAARLVDDLAGVEHACATVRTTTDPDQIMEFQRIRTMADPGQFTAPPGRRHPGGMVDVDEIGQDRA